MNERIKELLTPKLKEWSGDSGDNFSDELEKFAEAIVQRCASIISLYRRDNLQDKAIADTLEAAYKEIKLSFGVK